jgi:hypothetical protein
MNYLEQMYQSLYENREEKCIKFARIIGQSKGRIESTIVSLDAMLEVYDEIPLCFKMAIESLRSELQQTLAETEHKWNEAMGVNSKEA